MRPLTLGYLTFVELSPPDMISAARAGGFPAAGIRITGRYKSDSYFQVLDRPDMVRDIRQRLDDEGVRLSNISAYYVTADTTESDFKSVVDTSAALGAPLLIANRHDPDDRRYLKTMESYCDYAARAGIRLAVEFMKYSQAKSLADAVRVIDILGRDNFGLLCDPLHLSRSGGKPSDLRSVDPKRIFLAQICDAKGPPPADIPAITHEARSGRLNPGEGDLPLYDFLDALPAAVEVECEVPQVSDAGTPVAERARAIGEACRAFFAQYDSARSRRETGT